MYVSGEDATWFHISREDQIGYFVKFSCKAKIRFCDVSCKNVNWFYAGIKWIHEIVLCEDINWFHCDASCEDVYWFHEHVGCKELINCKKMWIDSMKAFHMKI